jgi:hypothetical protein
VHGVYPRRPREKSRLSKTLSFPLNRSRRLRRKTGAIRRAAPLLPLAALFFSVLTGCKQQEHHSPDVWAVVNGVEIRRAEAEKYYKSRINPEAQEASPEEILSGKLNVVEQLIDNESCWSVPKS